MGTRRRARLPRSRRWRYGWRGTRALKLVLVSMGLLLLAFFGSKFVLELLLQKG
jgi:ABC-type uncharacterized transport system permease subunit